MIQQIRQNERDTETCVRVVVYGDTRAKRATGGSGEGYENNVLLVQPMTQDTRHDTRHETRHTTRHKTHDTILCLAPKK